MGMSASQANLLSITSRMHDLEYKAQNIENQKIQLATQKDDLYQNYMDRLDATKIQVASGTNALGGRSYVNATFASVCQYDSLREQQYALRLADSNKVIVSDEVYDMYTDRFDGDKYAFAWAMIGLGESFSWNLNDGYGGRQGEALGVNANQSSFDLDDTLLMTDVEQKVFDAHSDDSKLKALFDEFEKVKDSDNMSEKRDAYKNFRNELYATYGKEIYQYMVLDKHNESNQDPDGTRIKGFEDKQWTDVKGEFDYYVRLFEEIQNSGGCVKISDVAQDGDTGNDWFNMMVNSGQVLIDMWSTNKKEWTETSVATSTTNNYLQEIPDTEGQKKAEIEYEHELDIINTKDKNFDRELSKLETERNALKTERDGIKQVKEDNIERTFGIFG